MKVRSSITASFTFFTSTSNVSFSIFISLVSQTFFYHPQCFQTLFGIYFFHPFSQLPALFLLYEETNRITDKLYICPLLTVRQNSSGNYRQDLCLSLQGFLISFQIQIGTENF